MGTTQIIAIVVFVVVMVAIVTEKIHRALAAVVGAMILLILHVVSFDAAMEHVDFNTLGVLLGMMLFVAVVKLSGLFEYLAIKCARLAKGNPWLVMVLFVCLTAVLSALLDNVTTVLLIGPMTVTVCRLLDPHRRPAQHHDRIGRGPLVRGLCHGRRAGGDHLPHRDDRAVLSAIRTQVQSRRGA